MCLICHTPYTSIRKCLDALPGTNEQSQGAAQGTVSEPRNPSTTPAWINMPGELISSAKTRGVKMQIMKWLREDPDMKIIVRKRNEITASC
jgi:hypothetical protein